MASKAQLKRDVEHIRLRLAEFHRFVRETAEMWGDPFTLRMLGNALLDLGYGREADSVFSKADSIDAAPRPKTGRWTSFRRRR